MKKAKIIAELCCNHMGDYNYALELVKEAKLSGADIVKFQKRDIETWINHKPNVYNNPHPNVEDAYGNTYAEHRRKLELDIEIHKNIKLFCDEIGIKYACSVFDTISAREIIDLNPYMIKIPSACNTNNDLLKFLNDNFEGEIHISLGMMAREKIEDILNIFKTQKKEGNIVLYACTSAYPLEVEDVCLEEIKILKDKYGDIVKGIGFSGHHSGIILDIAAYVLGAEYIERHFTLNKKNKGTDNRLSIEPYELRALSQNLFDVKKSITKKSTDILECEYSNWEKQKW